MHWNTVTSHIVLAYSRLFCYTSCLTSATTAAAQPDWCLCVPGRPRQVGRNQLVLDLSRTEVRDHIFGQLYDVLANANVEYIKWDMNRPLTEVYSSRGAADNTQVWQAETSHRFVLGLYDLQHRVRAAFPNILIENCASGGK